MLKRLLIFAITVLSLALLLGVLPIHSESGIYDSVLRLHILANSDSSEDQALKLKVRDEVLASTSHIFSGCSTRKEAEATVEQSLDLILSTAKAAVADSGYDYDVSIAFSREAYPTKNYESCCFPSGEYMSLQIIIGEGEGKNWWCVLFPPMCLSAAGESEEVFIQAGLTSDQYTMITDSDNVKYRVRFKLLEVIEKTVKG